MSLAIKPEYVEGNPMPPSIGMCADLYAEVRELRLAMQKVVDSVKARESEIKEHIIQNLSKSEDTGAAGKRYRAQVVVKAVPSLTDWDALTDHIMKTGNFDLLTKRLADKSVKDRWEAGESIPGIDRFNAVDVSITKI